MSRPGSFPILLLALTLAPASPAPAAERPASLAPLLEKKAEIASRLAGQAAYCSSRTDTNHDAFKGCIDWHSAVHGVWALVAYQQATGDGRHAGLVKRILSKTAIELERDYLKRHPGFEMPYGRAWFLRLAIDHERLTGRSDLRAMADEVAVSLRDFFRRAGVNPRAGSYDSRSWGLLNLLDYARHRKLARLQAEVEAWVRTQYVSGDLRCGYGSEHGHFMAVCTNWAAVVSRVLDGEAYGEWLGRFLAKNGLPEPVSRQASAHHYGLNFSRAWGLWDMYAKTDRADIAVAYEAHFAKGLFPETNWKGGYRSVGHWVAQFGMFALQPLFGPRAGR